MKSEDGRPKLHSKSDLTVDTTKNHEAIEDMSHLKSDTIHFWYILKMTSVNQCSSIFEIATCKTTFMQVITSIHLHFLKT